MTSRLILITVQYRWLKRLIYQRTEDKRNAMPLRNRHGLVGIQLIANAQLKCDIGCCTYNVLADGHIKQPIPC